MWTEREKPPPTKKSGLLKLDLSLPFPETPSASYVPRQHPKINVVSMSTAKCWNCQILGHIYRDCRKPKSQLFCYGCGTKGVLQTKCQKCNSKNELSGVRNLDVTTSGQSSLYQPSSSRVEQSRQNRKPFRKSKLLPNGKLGFP